MRSFIGKILDSYNFDFFKYRRLSFAVSLLLIFSAWMLIPLKGINFGTDFTGGVLLEAFTGEKTKISTVKSHLSDLNISNFSLKNLDKNGFIIKFNSLDNDSDTNRIKKILARYNFEYRRIDYVGPQISSAMARSGIIALFCALIGIFAYLCFSFSYRYAIGGVVALLHDLLVIFGIYIVFSIEFNLSSVAAILTILGYSINDSVVIFDRIRENSRKFTDKVQLINNSINTTLSRTVFTSFSTLLAVTPIIFLCSGEIRDFAIIIFSGIIVGTYSSIFIASPFVYCIGER